MYKITLDVDNIHIEKPKDIGLRFLEACCRADIYKENAPIVIFSVINMDTREIEYQI